MLKNLSFKRSNVVFVESLSILEILKGIKVTFASIKIYFGVKEVYSF
jgi:hypothetical protein